MSGIFVSIISEAGSKRQLDFVCGGRAQIAVKENGEENKAVVAVNRVKALRNRGIILGTTGQNPSGGR